MVTKNAHPLEHNPHKREIQKPSSSRHSCLHLPNLRQLLYTIDSCNNSHHCFLVSPSKQTRIAFGRCMTRTPPNHCPPTWMMEPGRGSQGTRLPESRTLEKSLILSERLVDMKAWPTHVEILLRIGVANGTTNIHALSLSTTICVNFCSIASAQAVCPY